MELYNQYPYRARKSCNVCKSSSYLVPRTTLIAEGNKSTLTSVAQGTLNLLQNKKGTNFDTSWTEAYTQNPIKFISVPIVGQIPVVDVTTQTNQTAQSFGIESIKIEIAGANFIPRVVIKFIDVRGKTLFELPQILRMPIFSFAVADILFDS